jgi:hypothetical protein
VSKLKSNVRLIGNKLGGAVVAGTTVVVVGAGVVVGVDAALAFPFGFTTHIQSELPLPNTTGVEL